MDLTNNISGPIMKEIELTANFFSKSVKIPPQIEILSKSGELASVLHEIEMNIRSTYNYYKLNNKESVYNKILPKYTTVVVWV